MTKNQHFFLFSKYKVVFIWNLSISFSSLSCYLIFKKWRQSKRLPFVCWLSSQTSKFCKGNIFYLLTRVQDNKHQCQAVQPTCCFVYGATTLKYNVIQHNGRVLLCSMSLCLMSQISPLCFHAECCYP
jgi:hypothetical protein